tara:strand:- start:3201 stop:5348 length:2148 start_codon:yes stop_codon:yes gene_type:complete
MRTLLLFIIFLSQQIAFGQSACTTYDGDYNKILSVLKNKNTLTGYDKYLDSELEKIAKYWVAVCKCEKGVKTREEANEIFMQIPASVPEAQYMYHGKMVKKKVAHFGDLIPTQKIYTASSCMSGSLEPANMKSSMDCTPEAANFYRTASDKLQFGKAYFRAFCECKNGAISTDRAKELIAEMKINHQNYHQYKAPSDPTLSKPITDYTLCAISSRGQMNSATKDKFSIYEDPLINSEVQGFIQELAANSNNPELITLSKELQGFNDVQGDVNEYRSMLNITASEQDLQFDQVMTNTAQAVSIIKFLINSTKDKEIVLTVSQKQAQAAMWDIRNNIKLVYDETRVLPNTSLYNQETIDRLDEYERSLYVYDLATARERKLVINYFWNDGYPSLEDVKLKMEDYNSKDPLALIELIDRWQQNANYDHALYLANSDKAFALTKYLVKLKKAHCYREMGMTSKAESILDNTNYKVSAGEAISIIIKSYKYRDYETVSSFFPIAKQYFKENKPSEFSNMYSIDQRATNDDLLLFPQDVSMLLASGIYANIKNNNLSQAEIDLLYLKKYNNLYSKNKNNLVLGLEACLKNTNKDYSEALDLLNKAIDQTSKFDPAFNWLGFMKFNILVETGKYKEAHDVYKLVNSNYTDFNKEYQSFFDILEFKYSKCELLFKQKDYETALYGLMLLESIQKNNKYYLLRANIYNAQGFKSKATIELRKIQ